MTTRRFADFSREEQDGAKSACMRAGIPFEEFEFFVEETVERGDGGRLRRIINIARKKPKVNRTYDASSTSDWLSVFEAAMLSGEFSESPSSRTRSHSAT